MCCPCESSTLTIRDTYWFPHQFASAFQAAVREAAKTGRRQRVYLYTFGRSGKQGWPVAPVTPETGTHNTLEDSA